MKQPRLSLVYSLVVAITLGSFALGIHKAKGSSVAISAPEGTEDFHINKDIHCAAPKVVVDNIISKFGELPIFATPLDDEVNIALFMNGKTKTWTIVEFLKIEDEETKTTYEYACLLETGTGGKIDLKNIMERNL